MRTVSPGYKLFPYKSGRPMENFSQRTRCHLAKGVGLAPRNINSTESLKRHFFATRLILSPLKFMAKTDFDIVRFYIVM